MASVAGIAVAVAVGGGLTVVVAIVALAWVRTQPRLMAAPAPASVAVAARTTERIEPVEDLRRGPVERVEGAGVADAVAGSGPRPR
jgi:hypothetical protein